MNRGSKFCISKKEEGLHNLCCKTKAQLICAFAFPYAKSRLETLIDHNTIKAAKNKGSVIFFLNSICKKQFSHDMAFYMYVYINVYMYVNRQSPENF